MENGIVPEHMSPEGQSDPGQEEPEFIYLLPVPLLIIQVGISSLLGLWKPQGLQQEWAQERGCCFSTFHAEILSVLLLSGAENEALFQQTEIWFQAHKGETGRQEYSLLLSRAFLFQGC